MTQASAPSEILNMVMCGCKTGCGKACGCQKHGLKCSIACKICMGQNCTNAESVESVESPVEFGNCDVEFEFGKENVEFGNGGHVYFADEYGE